MSLINKTRLFLLILLASLLCACAGAKPNIAIPATLPKSLVLKKRPDVAIVLGAGGARGFAHAGVLKVLQDAGVPINLVVGASAGAFYGALFADSGNAEQAKKIMLPRYEVVTIAGETHAQLFQIKCEIPSLRLVAVGEGSTRRKAEQMAAKFILQQIKQR